MSDPPTIIRAHQAEQSLELAWEGEPPHRVPYLHIRAHCPCAGCRDEWTGRRLLDPATIRPDLQLVGMEQVGSYAVRLGWNDGHDSGLYTWDLLRELATAPPDEPGAKWSGIDPPGGAAP
jgi:DUF971 family protein